MKKFLGVLLMVLVLSGCSSLFVKEPVVTVKGVDLVSVDAAGVGMEVELTIENRNGYDIKLLGYSYDLQVMALPLAKGGTRETVTFPAATTTDLRIPIRLGLGELMEILKRIPNPDRVPYRLKAGLDLDSPFGHLSVPVDKSGTYQVPAKFRPSFYLDKVRDFFGVKP